jgi:2-oxoglutarate dehydrogenase E1 component
MRKFFDGFDFAILNNNGGSAVNVATTAGSRSPIDIDWMKEIRAYRMILGYRNKGHLLAKTNPYP